jgi:NADPH-ferrihemoprotein reductase
MLHSDVPRQAHIFIKNSNFIMNNDVPLLMVGPGTGVVPFIAFCQEREQLKSQNKAIAEAHLFFGCRDKDSDFIYRDYLANMLDTKVLNSLNLAFSRPKDKSGKMYV